MVCAKKRGNANFQLVSEKEFGEIPLYKHEENYYRENDGKRDANVSEAGAEADVEVVAKGGEYDEHLAKFLGFIELNFVFIDKWCDRRMYFQ